MTSPVGRTFPAMAIQNLQLFKRVISNLSVARDGDTLFRFVANNGGRASDFENLVDALRAFGVYKRDGHPFLVNDGLLKLDASMWLVAGVRKVFKDLVDEHFLTGFQQYYSSPDTLQELQRTAVVRYSCSADDAQRIADTVKIINEEIWVRMNREKRQNQMAKFFQKIIVGFVILLAILTLGYCLPSSNRDCDYDSRGEHCTYG